MTIANNDLNEGSYTITLTGTVTTPEIDLEKGGTPIASGGSVDFGSLKANAGSAPVVFTIRNPGTAELNLTGISKVDITGTDKDMFTVLTQPTSPISPAGSVDFTITFAPTSAGAKSASLYIASDDSNENPYVISLTGTGTVPDMNIRQDISSIENGTGSFDFGAVLSGTSGAPVTFSIENLGQAELNLTGTPKVDITGTDKDMFTVGTQPASTVAPSGSVDFTITFRPAKPGSEERDGESSRTTIPMKLPTPSR